MEILSELSEIVLKNVYFDDMEHTRVVLSGMAGLMSVDINLAAEEEADLMLRDLPNLHVLNGHTIDREQLE